MTCRKTGRAPQKQATESGRDPLESELQKGIPEMLSCRDRKLLDLTDENPAIISQLALCLGEDVDVRQGAAWAIANAVSRGADVEDSMSMIALALEYDDKIVRKYLSELFVLLAEKGKDISIAVPGLAKCLGDPDAAIRGNAAEALHLGLDVGGICGHVAADLAGVVAEDAADAVFGLLAFKLARGSGQEGV